MILGRSPIIDDEHLIPAYHFGIRCVRITVAIGLLFGYYAMDIERKSDYVMIRAEDL